MSYIVSDCEARVLILDAGIEPAAELAARHVGDARRGARHRRAGSRARTSTTTAVAAAPGGPLADPTPGSLMLYTSGTTGRPKGVRKRPNPPVVENIAGYEAESVHLCTGPLYHAAPLNISLISPLSNGAAVVLMDRWTAEETAAARRAAPGDPHARGADDVPPPARARRRDARRVTTSRRCGSSCTARRRARSR